jgi:preprotein translocase SecF subunit
LALNKKPVKKIEKIAEPVVLGERNYKFDFVRKSKWGVIFSLTFIVVGLVMFLIRGFNFGIDFLGGNLMEIKFTKSVSITELRNVMEEVGYGSAILQNTEENQYIIRTVPLTDTQKTAILDNLDSKIGIEQPLVQDRNVAPGFSQTIIRNTLIAVAISIAGILIYVWIRFAVRFALIAILELIHDLLIILSFYAITFREFNTTTIAVILTILGYSLSDAIIIFDRIREEIRVNKRDRFIDISNYSVNKTLVRSLGTAATTLFPIIVLLIIGNETLKDFAFGLFIGIISGSFSSIFVGPQILVAWNNRFPRYKK